MNDEFKSQLLPITYHPCFTPSVFQAFFQIEQHLNIVLLKTLFKF